MRHSLLTGMVLVASALSVVCAEIPDAEQTRSDFERLSTELPYLSLSSVLYDRTDHGFRVADDKAREEHFRILGEVTDISYPQEELIKLLDHGDAKVRTLAAVALYDREDPAVLPFLVELCEDKTETFDGHAELSATWLSHTGIGPPAKKQTVGDIATKMISFYMHRSGFYHEPTHKTQPGFAEYWEARKNRSHCAGWFAVQLARASQGISPTQKDCISRIRSLHERINELPSDERTWILLWLNGETGSDALATEEELIEACQSVGPDKLLLMLQNKIPSNDPDLQPRAQGNWPYQRMSLFVLRHADQLLGHDDSDALLACEAWQRDYQKHGISDPTITAWWAVAAAQLNPAKAKQILHAAMDRFQGRFESVERATLCEAMWRLCGQSELNFILNWFFEELPERGSFSHCRALLIQALGQEPNGRDIIAPIIQDERLDDLDWQSLEQLVRVVNEWAETPIVDEEAIRKASHPFGQGHYHWEKNKAKEDYPKETEELERQLSDWREQLRMSAPELLEQQNNERIE